MEHRRLGTSGLRVSRAALGTMTWGRDTDEDDAARQLAAFRDAGGTLLDTADRYADGESERVLGRLLRGVPRDDVVIATKAGTRSGPGPLHQGTSRRRMLAALDGSLARLGVDAVDLWQVHLWDGDTPLEETLAALDNAVVQRPGALRRDLELQRLADGCGRRLATGAGRVAVGFQPDGVLPAGTRRGA